MATKHEMLQITLCMLLYTDFVSADQVIVESIAGLMTGKNFTTRKGRNIAGFLGIPYAKPPVGHLRFKNPEPAEPWDGIFVADTDGNQCPQIDDNGSVVGNEDCLFLNVYTPNPPPNYDGPFLPVMVYIHGGDFVRGNGSSILYGPEYLLDEDIVLVTLNYRLGVLGFLATGDRYATGNFGLKDQVLALKWVQTNILFFGGHPYKVTLFGQGAGSASVSLHAGTDLSDDLFQQYISQSGTAVCFWAFHKIKDYKKHSTDLGEYLNCSTKNSELLTKCLRQVDIDRLVDTDDIFDHKYYRFSTWGPTEEPSGKGSILSDPVIDKFLNYGLKSYPSITGHTRDEGLILTAQFYTNNGVYEKIENNFDDFVRHIVKLFFKDDSKTYVDRAKIVYFNGTKPSDKETFTKQMTNFLNDAVFLYPADFLLSASTIEYKSFTHYYSFEYRGTISQTSRVIGNNDNIGVTHADELIYLFPMPAGMFNQEQLQYSESDNLMIDTMIELWSTFARTGVPSSKRFPEGFSWPLYSYHREYIQIGNNASTSLKLSDNFNAMHFSFWNAQMNDELLTAYLKIYHY